MLFSVSAVKSQNTLSINNVTGCTSTTATIQVVMNNALPVVAFQMDVPLPTGFTYVGSSIALLRGTANHSISASIIGTNTLRILSYSNPVTAYTGSTGIIATFQVTLPGAAGSHALNIQNAILSDASGANIISGTVGGTATVNAVPAQPSVITGATNPCQGSSQVYSVTNVAGVTYNWTFPAGWTQTAGGTTNSVTVTVGANAGNVTVTPSNACGNGTAQTLAVTVNTVPAQPSVITGATNPCLGSSQVYSVTNVAGVTYNWTFPAGWTQTAGGTTNSVTVTVGANAGNVSVTPSNACGNGTARTLAVTVNTVPAQPSAITGATNPCQTSSQVYSVTNVAGVTYNWTFPAGWTQTAGGTTNSVTVTVGAGTGNVTVTPSNICGNGTASTLAVTVNTVPAQPSVITGATTPCQGSSQVYSVTNVAGVTYNWTFPAGWTQTAGGTTNSVTVTVGAGSGNVSVTPSNICGNGTARTLAVTVTTVPAQPSAITGATNPCQTSSQVYSVTNVAGVTYNWTFPAGWTQTAGGTTNSVTVTVGASGGNVSVTPSNACGNGTAQTLAVTVNTVPAQPSVITGATTPCETSSQVYSVTNVAGVTYNWTFPAGWTQTAGGTTNSVTVTVGAGSGNVSVTPSNVCGNGTASTLAVTTTAVPAQPSVITGATTPCQGTSQVYSVTNVAGVTYNWTFPAGWTQTAGGTTNSITVTVGAGSGNVTVTPSNACGNGTARSLAVTVSTVPAQPSVITGAATPAFGTSQVYSVTNVAGVTYNWTYPADWTQTAGGTTNSVTATVGIQSGNITVTPSNVCGNGTARTLAVAPVKGTPTITWPTATAITYGAQLSAATLSGGSAEYLGSPVPGTFTYLSPTFVPNAGTYVASVRFTPTDTDRYNTVDGTVNVTVNARALTLTANAQSKVYGDADPVFTYAITTGSLYGTDVLVGTPTRILGQNVGNYAINQGTVAASPTPANYVITWVSANLTITARPITVTADAGQSKVYGDANPVYTYTAPALQFTDTWTGALARAAGENVGSYAINIGTLAPSAPGNYTVTFVGANFAITPKAITVTANSGQTKVYGAVDPTFTYTASGVIGGDTPSGALARTAGQNVGTYPINIGTLSYGANYTITFVAANFTITQRALTITANDITKTVGILYTFTGTEFTHGTLYYSDAVTSATITSTGAPAGAAVGTYPIVISAAVGAGLANYNISYVNGTLTVQDLIPLTLDGAVASNKVYDGNSNATITSWGTLSGVQGGDVVTINTAAASAAFNNKNVGVGKTVTLSNVILDGPDAYKYYLVTPTTTANITQRTLTLSTFTANNKVYDRTTDVTGTGFSDNRIGGDVLTFTFTAAFADFNVGVGKTVNYTGIAISGGTDAGNYVLASTVGSTTANITPRPITVTATAQSKVYGDADPVLTYTVTGLIAPDAMSGALTRVAGENIGAYAIQQGTLTAGANYTISYTGANLTITAKAITVTAEAKTKVYGQVDPALTYVVVGLVGGDTMSGALTRAAGNNVGTYAILQGTLTAGSNYTITYTGANFTITPKGLTVTAEAKTKVYGQIDPALTYVVTGLETGDSMSGALTRVAGNNVGVYAIQQGTLTAGANYTINYTGANFTITAKPITVTANAQSKVYGSADPALTYVVAGLETGDSMSGALTRAAGENIGTYAINQGTLTAGANYTITYNGALLTITAKALTVTAEAKTKVYGQVDPALTYVVTGLETGDSMSGALTRVAGNNVGVYAIQQGTLTAGANYTITYVGANFTITAKPITVAANAQTKVYGQADPALTYVVTGLETGDSMSGSLTRVAGENVGTYAINQGTLTAGGNYTITYTGANFTITAKVLTITANNITKIFGETYTFTGTEFSSVGLIGTDAVTSATITSTGAPAGAAVGTYPIVISAAVGTGLSNYSITYVNGTMTVENKILLTISGLTANNKPYDSNNTATISSYGTLVGVQSGDVVTLVTTSAVATFNNKNVGDGKTVTVTGLTLGGADANKYTIASSHTTTANITVRTVTLFAFTASNKVYDRTTAATGTGFSDDRVAGDVLTFTYTAAFDNFNVGVGKTVNYTAIAISGGTDAGNYTLASTTGSATANITPRPITVTADAKTKVYGDSDPTLTYIVSGLIAPDAMSGALTRVAGENVGTWAIQQGTLTAGANYTITYTGANLTITPKAITVTANSGQTKVYGAANPVYTYTASGVVGGDTPTGALARTAGENIGTYPINIGTLSYGANYTVTFVAANFTITAKPITVTAEAKSKVYGQVDPALTYVVVGLVGGDTMSGALTRVAGENIGTYAIQQGTLTAGTNYTITYTGALLTITAKSITVTADAKTKVYGDVDPALTYVVTGLETGDSMSGALTRVAGNNIGTYAIQQGTLTAGSNYTINYVGANFTITAKAITVTANSGQTKVYGAADPVFTYTAVGVVGADAPTGALSRVAGNNVGTYAITIGTLSYGANYTITFVSANFTITAKSITVTADAKSKVYGSADPALTYVVTGLETGDSMSGALTRVAGTNVGTYAIQQGTLTAGANYTINYVGALLTITAKSITVTADAKTKVYGEVDPALTYVVTGLETGDSMSGALSRAAGSNVGTYAILQGTLSAGANYTINYVGANLTITAKAITVTANAGQTKVYGSADPVFTYTAVGVVGADAPSGALSRVTPSVQTVGTYAITQGTLTYGANYTITFVSADFTITAKALTVTANNRTKSVGQTLTFLGTEFTTAGLVFADEVTSATITSTGAPAGAAVGTYPIVISAAVGTGLTNYTISYVNGTLTVADLIELSLTGLTANNKVYDATSTATISNYGTLTGVLGGDVVTLVTTGSTAAFNNKVVGNGKQVIVVGLSLAGADAHKYFIDNQTTTANITPKDLTLSSFTASNKIYDGTTSVTGTGFSDDRLGTDVLNFTFTAAFVDRNVGVGKNVNYTGITISGGVDAGNYNLVTTSGTATANITPRTLNIEAVAVSKVYGDADPAFTYTIISGLQSGDDATIVTGTLTRVAGEDVGTYAIQVGTLTAGTNYAINFISRNLTITPKAITVTADAGQTKVYGSADPVFTFVATGVVGADAPTGALSRASGNDVGTYAITLGTLSYGGNYTITFVSELFTITPKAITVTADGKSKVYGSADPALTYVVTGLEFGDAMSGTLTRVAGEDVGTYAIQQGTLTTGANYTITYVGANLSITAKEIFVYADAKTKVYGAADPALTYAVVGLVGGDLLSGALARAAGENVGVYAINIGTLTGGANYTINFTPEDLTITPRGLTVTANNAIKVFGQTLVFDGTEFTHGALSFTDEVTSVTLTSAGADAAAAVGTYPIEPSAAVGVGLGNYNISYVNGVLTITDKIILTISGLTADNKVYDGYTDATISNFGSLVGVIGSDDVTLDTDAAVAFFSNKNVANGKVVTVTGLILDGVDADKYILAATHFTNADITVRSLALSNFTADDKVYDGGITVAGTGFDNDVLIGDVVEFSYTAQFEDKNVGVDKNVNYTGIAISGGTDMNNYNLATATGTAIASITAREVTIGGTFTVLDKVYDGTTAAVISNNNLILLGAIGGDFVNLANVIAEFESADINTDITVNIVSADLDGGDKDNYSLSLLGAPTATADIFEPEYTLTLLVNPVDAGVVTGAGVYFAGTDVDITAAVLGEYVFVKWTNALGVVVSILPDFTYTMPANNVTLTANFMAIDDFEVIVNIVPVDGGFVTGAGFYAAGADVTLTATPEIGYYFVNWTDTDDIEVTADIEYTFTMPDHNVELNANFAQYTYTLSLMVNPENAGIVTGEGVYVAGLEIEITAAAEVGFEFVNWTTDLGVEVSNQSNFTYTMPAEDVTLIANFKVEGQYEVIVVVVPEEGGVVTGAGFYFENDEVVIEAVANLGYTFVSWEVDGTVVETAETYTFNMMAEDITVTANFEANFYEIILISSPAGAGVLTGAGSYIFGTEVEISAVANEDWKFVNWILGGEIISVDATFNYVVTAANVNLYAIFVSENEYEVTITVVPEEGGSVAGAGWYELGTDVEVQATANAGYTFIGWELNGATVETATTYTFTMPEEDVNLIAKFEINVHTLTLVANPAAGGTLSGGGNYAVGTVVPVSATPAANYSFVRWTIGATVVSTSASFNYTMPDNNVTLTANFEVIPDPTYTLTVVADPEEGGSVTGGGEYEAGTSVTVIATANANFTFTGWYLGGTLVSEASSFTFNMPAENITLVGKFGTVNVNDPSIFNVSLYPNPSKGNVIITSDRIITEVKVYDMIGKVVHTAQPDAAVIDLMLNVEPGMYFVRIYTQAGQSTIKLQITK